MSDFLDQLSKPDEAVEREVSYTNSAGEVVTGNVLFKRISAGQRQQLLQGQKYTHKKRGDEQGDLATEIDLGHNEQQQHLLVSFSVCRADGKPYFAGASAVAKVEHVRVKALYKVAAEVNKEDKDDDAGKS